MIPTRIIGPGRAGSSLHRALSVAHWPVEPLVGRDGDIPGAADGVQLVVIATPDAAVAEVAAAIRPNPQVTVAHLSGSLGLAPLASHERRAVIHPLVALPDPERGAQRLVGAWFGVAADGDPAALAVVEELHGRTVTVAEGDWARYHAAAVIAANHLVALMGQVQRVADTVGAPLDAFLALAQGSLDDVAALGPAAALTGPVSRGDWATVERHIEALPDDERDAYRTMAQEAEKLCR